MRTGVNIHRLGGMLASALFACACLFTPVKSAHAVASLNLSTSFTSADPARANAYMDAGGTWDGTNDVSNTGDIFSLTISNTATGSPGNDSAFDLEINLAVPAGFDVPSNTVNVTEAPASCPNINATAQQPGGAGNPVRLVVPSNTDIRPGCSYIFRFGMIADNTVSAGTYPVDYTVSYNAINNNNASQVDVLITQNIEVRTGALAITKTTPTATAIDGDVITYDITVSSTGSGGLFDVVLTDIISADLGGLSFTVPDPPPGSVTAADEYTFEYLAAGEVVNLTVDATVAPAVASTCPVLQNDASLSERTGVSTAASGPVLVDYDFQLTSGSASNVISHVAATSFCEFCDTGEVHIRITNPTTAALQNITLVENLQALGLTYIPGSTTASIGGAVDPTITGGGTLLTWTPAQIGALASLAPGNTLDITFRVSTYREASILADPNRNIIASVTFDMACISGSQTLDSGQFELPIRQPEPNVIKQGRNYDAGQTAAAYTDIIYGSRNDDVIWRVNVQNAGAANMEALRMNDSITGNFNINFICPDEASANDTAASNGVVGGAGCIGMTTPFDVDDPFGNAPDPDDVTANSNTSFIYYVGRILNTHTNETNNAGISWGCELDSPAGGLITVPASTSGVTPGVVIADSADLSTTVVPANLLVSQNVTGSNPSQPLGTKGLITITLDNQTGGSVKNIKIRATLPVGYVMDNTYGVVNGVGTGQPTFTRAPAYGNNYPGFIDTFTRDDAALLTADPLDDLQPTFTLTSSTVGADAAQQVNMLRHGDVVTLTFGIIMIEPARFDLAADLDVTEEIVGDADPASALALSNEVYVDFDSVPNTGLTPANYPQTFNYSSGPEDLDVDISDSLFILTNDINVPLDLNVILTNNGAHDADDYTVYVTFGQAMTVQTPASGCLPTTNPPPHPHWNDPAEIPITAAVYACNRGVIAPGAGAAETITFSVIKNTNTAADDDLTFRADVVGEITRFDDSALIDPAPASIVNTTPNLQLANNYSLDAIRSRVLGFNLTKSMWYCAESGTAEPAPSVPPPATPADLNTQIGEDCNYHIESGGWFGFITPGYTLIAVQDIVVTDDLPDGQGFIHFDASNPYIFTNTPNISFIGVNGGAATTPLNEADISWQFNAAGNGIVIKDEYFRVDLKTRFLNDPVDVSAVPNIHSATSTNIARTAFNALFQSDPVMGVPQPPLLIPVSDVLGIPGYPLEPVRRVDMTVTEPNIIVVKEVCNETLYGVGTACSNFTSLANDGDTNDSYIYRVVLTNEASNSGVTRAPAFNVISTDTLDVSDLMLIDDFASDGLDNDGDGLIDAADPNEGSISENAVMSGGPAVITVSNTHSTPLLRVDPGDSVTFFYRVDPDDAIAPLQTLTNTVSMSYDSLDGDFGNQNAPQLDNTAVAPNDAGRARIYTTIDALANVRMIPLLAQPKAIIALSNSASGGSPQDVVIGEEIRYQLTTQLPVANLRQFVIRDRLPAGVRCVENGPAVDLGPGGPHAAAGFNPGGIITPVCNAAGNEMIWNFGDQELTMSPGTTRYDFIIDFVARVENTAFTNEGVVIRNGGGVAGGGTDVTASYVNESGTSVVLDFAAVDIVVREPVIALTKSFAVANSDAADVLTVTVTATNNGTAAAYNLRVLDDLVGSDLSYIAGSISGTDPPDNVDTTTFGLNQPIFSWDSVNPDYEIAPTAVKTFTFNVRVDTTAQPLEILDNTIQAKWDSLPGQTTALNASGAIGADGSALGLRNGVLPNAADAVNDYEAVASASTSVLPLAISKTDLDPAVLPTIGAHKNFRIEIALPEGTTNNLVVTDDLIFSGLSYFLSNNPAFDVTYSFQDIATINGQPPAEAAFTASPADNASGSVVWNIGTVVTDEENDTAVSAVNPVIRINYFARVNNDLLTDAGDTLQNSVTLNYSNGESAATEALLATTPAVTVLEPLLSANKTVTNQTNPGVDPDGGDVLEYQITINNTGDSTAFDVNIVDTLPPQLLFDTGYTPTAEINAVAVAGFVATPAAAPAGPLVWGRGNADNTLDIPAGGNLVLTYRTVVQAITEPNITISNAALIDWTSLDDGDLSEAFERTGAGCPAITPPDDYCTAPAVSTINTIDNNSIVKSIILDTYDVPPLSTAIDSIVRVGDTVTYRLDINIQEGTTRNINVVDTLPGGMTFVDVVSINGDTTPDYDAPAAGAGSNFAYATITAASVPAVGATGALSWNLGTVTNDAAGDATTDTLVIEYRARVTENAGIAQVDSDVLSNTAVFSYIDGNGAPSPGVPRLTSTANLTVLQPIMDALTKTDRSGRISGNTINVATDVMNFRLHSCNTTGLAPAYGLRVTDNLPTQLNETTLAGPVNGALAPDVLINGVLATEGAGNDYVYTPPAVRGGDMVFVFNTPIDPGACVDIDFDIGFYNDFAANLSWSNTVTVDEYWSLPPADAQLYPAIGPVPFNMNNNGTVFPPPEKTMTLPAPAIPEATIGDEIVYQIRVPATPVNAVMYDVTITDTLDSSLLYLGATDVGTSAFAITDNTVLPGNVNLVIPQIPAGQQAIIELRARVDNNGNADAGDAFINTAAYTFANSPGGVPINGGSDNTASTLTIIEPAVAVAKAVTNLTNPGNAPDAGDVLRYTISLTASGGVSPGDLFSDAFDLSIADSLSSGLLYNGNLSVDGAGNTIAPPIITGDGSVTPQTLNWSLADGNADIDIVEGTVVTINYEVLVLDVVQANQNLSNAVNIQWHSRDGPDINQRDGSGAPAFNDYFNVSPATTLQVTPDNNIVTKSRLSDTFESVPPPGDNVVRIGDIVDFELRINLQEGTHPNTVITDNLPRGMVFEETLSINGDTIAPYTAAAPFSHPVIAAAVVTGDPTLGPTAVSWTAGDIVNAGDNLANNDFVIVYRARVLDLVHPQQNNIALTNNVSLDYGTATGAAPVKTDSEALDLQQPDLSVAKVQVFTPTSTDSTIDAGETVRFMVSIANNGTAPAYDTELLDIIPAGLRSPAVTVIDTRLVVAGTDLPDLAPAYDPVTGTAVWNFDSGVANQYNIPAGDTLELVYEVQADAGLGTGLTLTNNAQVQFYYSFDNDAVPANGVATGVREIYGPSNIAQVVLDTLPAPALLKTNPTDLDVSIGETFTYQIKVPGDGNTQATALYDVRILDNLIASAADLQFVSVTKVVGSQPWVPVNTGTVTDDLVIADVTNGIDIPANEQAIIDVTVTLRNSDPPNVAGLLFNNSATYTFNRVDNDIATQSNGSGVTTANMRVVEPELTLDKRGPPGTVNFSVPITYTLVAENIGTGPAFDTTIVDQLPDVPDNPPLTGGTCNTAPVNFNARITASADEAAVLRALVPGTDYTATHTAAPACELVITTITDAARIEAGEKLIVSYDASLDTASQSGASLTNIAGATRWFSLDTAGAGATGEIREYTRTITNGTTSLVDHEDAFNVIVDAPVLGVQKTVVNMTTGQNPGSNASPGDVLRYTITVNNGGIVDATGVTVSDAIPANATYIADSVTLNGLPVSQPDAGVSPLIAGIDVSSSDLTPPLPAAGNGIITVAQTATITFDVLLDPVITSGTVISNQAFVNSPSTGSLPSDDPNINGNDDPVIIGDEDQTQTLIASAPQFEVFKTSQDITGDPGILLSGDTLRYTITVKNVGGENANNARLRDQLPANTTYVANSTRLNGAVVADLTGGVPPLQNGILINAPENTTPGFMRADASAATGNVATISFDVVINNNVVNGTIISNQGFLTADGAGSGLMPEKPTDDPATAVVDDPTLDVVGNQPLVDAHKTVSIAVDNNANGTVDPGDVLRYTISISNMGATPATGVTFIDGVPADTTYFADSTTLNGIPVGQPDGGVSPLVAGIDVSSSDLTPPLPAAGNGTLSAGGTAVVSFNVTVNDGVVNAPGPAAIPGTTIISNQGSVDSNELPAELTDADGIDANGDQPTLIAVGNAQLLSITKTVAVVGGGPALAGGQLEYRVRVSNIGSVAASNVVITDDLPAQLSYTGSGLLNGLPAGVSFADPRITADFAAVYGDLQPGLSAELRFIAQIDNALPIGTTITNTGNVSWNSPAQTASASVSIDIGGTPGLADLNGMLWHDANFNNVFDSGELPLQGWLIDVYRGAQQLGTFTTDSNGVYGFNGLLPNDVGTDRYELRFRAPGAGGNTAPLGLADSPYLNDLQRIYDIVVNSGSNVQNLNLPIDPNGVVYDSVLRTPVSGATLTLLNASNGNTQVPAGCFVDAAQQNQVTLASGYYKFDLNFSGAGCSAGDAFVVQVTPPANGYIGTVSRIIPPTLALNDPAFSVPACPGSSDDRLSTSPEHCEIQGSVFAPPTSVQPRTAGTAYYLKFNLADSTDPYTRQIFNNHIPLDPELDEAVAISKTSSLLNVTRSQQVPYTITVNNSLGVPLQDMDIVDNYPAGFKYVANSARIDGVASEPVINGLQMSWPNQTLEAGENMTIKMLLVVGAGVGEGEYINRVQAINNRTGEPISGQASATVRVIPDPTFDCTDVIGKVFADSNMNGYQDEGEAGIPSARVVTARGIEAKTDKHGRFHITCAVVPNEDRGSNFIIKLDERSLPGGYRVTTENPRVERATRGKMLKFNFGAGIHRVVRLDMADAVFEPNTTEIRPQWLSRVSLLMEKLVEAPSILRLAYMADVEDADLVEDRLKATKKEIQRRWADLDCCYTLEIETEIFWRRGRPADKEGFK